MNKNFMVLVLLWMGSLLPFLAIPDATGDATKPVDSGSAKKAVGAATSVIGGKKAAAVKAIDRASDGQVKDAAKQGADAAAETVKEGVDKVTGDSADKTESK